MVSPTQLCWRYHSLPLKQLIDAWHTAHTVQVSSCHLIICTRTHPNHILSFYVTQSLTFSGVLVLTGRRGRGTHDLDADAGRLNVNMAGFLTLESLSRAWSYSAWVSALYLLTITSQLLLHGKIDGISPYDFLPSTKCKLHTRACDLRVSFRIRLTHGFLTAWSFGTT